MRLSGSKPKRSIWLKFILSTFFLIILCLGGSAYMLKRGITLDSFSIANISVSSFSLQWHEKLEMAMDNLTITPDSDITSPGVSPFSGSDFITVFKLGRIFSKVSIATLQIGDLKGSLQFDQTDRNSPSFFTIASNDFSLHSSLSLEDEMVLVAVSDIKAPSLKSTASVKIRIDTAAEIISGNITANIANSLPLTLSFTADRKGISFEGRESGKITTITPLVDLFGLDHNIQRWITDYLTGSRYNLKTVRGTIPWGSPQSILQDLYAEVRVEDCEYTFAPGLEPIKTSYTDVVFEKGVLSITPHDSTFYGQDGEKSWLDINFNDPSAIILTAYILTHAQANDDIIRLLNYYDIPLPFKQTKGKTDTNLTLAINLNDTIVTAKGLFLISEGELEENNKRYDVKNVRVSLTDSTVLIENGSLHYQQFFDASINGKFDAATGFGDLDITLQKLYIKTQNAAFHLDDSKESPVIRFHIRPDNNSLSASKSSWKLGAVLIDLAPFTTPFSYTDYSGDLSPTLVTLPIGISALISGPFSLKDLSANLHGKLLRYNVKNFVLETSGTAVDIEYKDELLTIRNLKKSHWKVSGTPASLSPSKTTLKNDILSMTKAHISYGDFFDSDLLNCRYDLSTHNGELTLSNLQVNHENIGQLLNSQGKDVPVTISNLDDSLTATLPTLDLIISSKGSGSWSAKLTSLSRIHSNSKILQKLQLDTGSFTISSANGEKPYQFSADIDYRFALLRKDNKPINHYNVTGEINDTSITATVNDALTIQYDKNLTVHSKDIAYNLPGIINFSKTLTDSSLDTDAASPFLPITLDAENSAIVLNDDRQLLANRIHFDNANDMETIILSHEKGEIKVKITGDTFSLSGENLDDVFMDGIIPGAAFQGGVMSAAAQGTVDDFSALVKIEKTTLREYRMMHNILALLNTIPALVTFSLPEFDTDGLPIDSVILGFRYDKGLAPIKTLVINSPEFDLAGKGQVNFNEKTIDIDANIITRAGANISHIPLAGFILAGDEKRPSITLKISGKLDDPQVTTSMFKEVSTMPFAILYRTLTLPVHLINSMNSDEDEDK